MREAFSWKDLPSTYWLTRDRIGGELSSTVEVWAVRPERHHSEDGDVMWLAPFEYLTGEMQGDTSIDEWTLADAHKRVGPGIPENDRECTRVGRE